MASAGRVKRTSCGRALPIVLAALALSAPAAGAHSRFVGVNAATGISGVFAGTVNASREFDLMMRSGVESVRVSFIWSVEQPYSSFASVPARSRFRDVDGTPTDFSATDGIVRLAAARGMTVLPVVLSAPCLAPAHLPAPAAPLD